MPTVHAIEPVRVVVMDDTPDIRLLLRVALEAHGQFRVVGEAGDGRAGVELVRRERPDLAVLDLAMPVMDGLEALTHIRRESPGTRTVVLSASESHRMADRARAAGADTFLQKGTSARRIVAAICSTMGLTPAPAGTPTVRSTVARTVASAPAADPSGATRAELDRVHVALAGAAHELRGPATVLLAMTELLSTERDAIDAPTFDRMLDAIQRQAQVLDRVTGDLLTSTQSQRGVLSVDLEPVRLAPLVDGAALGVAERAALRIECPAQVQVCADPTRVQQMLDNLVSNALKYGAAPITVTVAERDGFAHVRVADRGLGVPEPFRERLFGQFARAEGARVNGMGLGLFVVRSLAEAQGGQAWYEPVPGGGSAFCFTLPVAA
ncbi:MAG TPA: response regulator [Jatrophihabitans sp.]|jgi:signal transduction histidine kinase